MSDPTEDWTLIVPEDEDDDPSCEGSCPPLECAACDTFRVHEGGTALAELQKVIDNHVSEPVDGRPDISF